MAWRIKTKISSPIAKQKHMAFLRDSIELVKNIKTLRLPFIHLDSRPLKLTSARPYGTYFNMKTTKNLTSFKITTSEDETSLFQVSAKTKRTYAYIIPFEDKDSVSTHFTARDSINNLIDTTLYVKFSNRDVKPENFTLSLKRFNVVGTKGLIQGQIQFTKPILAVNFDSIFYSIDSTQRISFNEQDLHWDSLAQSS